MEKLVFTIHDKVSNTYDPLFVADTDEMATRMVIENASDSRSQFAKYPNDFALYKVGTFDVKKCDLKHSNPICILSTIPIIKSEAPQ